MSDYKVTEVGAVETWGAEGKHFVDKELDVQYAGLSVNSTEPGGESPFWHAHSKLEEVYIVIDGQGEMVLNDEVVPLNAGTTVRVGPGVMHALRALPDSPTPMRWLCVRAGGEALITIGHDSELDRERPFPWNA